MLHKRKVCTSVSTGINPEPILTITPLSTGAVPATLERSERKIEVHPSMFEAESCLCTTSELFVYGKRAEIVAKTLLNHCLLMNMNIGALRSRESIVVRTDPGQ